MAQAQTVNPTAAAAQRGRETLSGVPDGLVPLVLAAGEPGKEILYPVATVILGGLISSTLLDFFVHPALFWCFGRRSAQEQIDRADHDELGDFG